MLRRPGGPAEAATTGRVGAQHTLNAEYFKRIDALNYSMMHDDGQHVEGLEEAFRSLFARADQGEE